MRRVLCGSGLVFLSSSCLRVTPLFASISFLFVFFSLLQALIFFSFVFLADGSFIKEEKKKKKKKKKTKKKKKKTSKRVGAQREI